MEDLIRKILVEVGEDPGREGLGETPARVARALRELTSGYAKRPEEALQGALFESSSRGLVVCRDIRFVSLCEHHLLPFHGTMTVGFKPAGRLVGISKLVRLAEVFARRLQVQERLGQQILEVMEEQLRPAGALVSIRALHLCMVARGVRQSEATMETLHTSGVFEGDPGLVRLVLHGRSE